MNVEEIKNNFRTPAMEDYPELQGYSRADVYNGKMGPGGLYLAAQIARGLNLSQGQRVLDLGCGRGASSIFLAKHYEVSVVAVDLWISATKLYQQFQKHGVEDRVVPLNLDVTKDLPFADDYFNAIFCMDSVHYYGGTVSFWNHLLPHLKRGGRLGVGSPCFNQEFSPETLKALPSVYDDGTDLWPDEFSKYHSPAWWKGLIQNTGGMDVIASYELEDGVIYWEDDILNNLEKGGSTEDTERDVSQITFREQGIPYLTHFVLCAEKR